MVTKLKGKKPDEVIASRPKFMVSGKSGIGKTYFALGFPTPYLIDVEGGATRLQYQKKLKESDGAYMGKDDGSQDFKNVLEEIKLLATTKHPYKTLIIDSFSKLYNLEAAKAEAEGGSDFGRDKKEANKPTRQLIRWIDKVDMTVILICHKKDKWKRIGKEVVCEGSTFDGYDKLEYELDLWIEVLSRNNFIVQKSRVDNLKEGEAYDLKYEKFADIYGNEAIEKESALIKMATPAQVEKIGKLLEIVKLDDKVIAKWFSSADVEEWSEFTYEQLEKCIGYLNKKMEVK